LAQKTNKKKGQGKVKIIYHKKLNKKFSTITTTATMTSSGREGREEEEESLSHSLAQAH